MGKKKKVTIITPPDIYIKMIQRAYELDLNHREYYLGVIMRDLGMIGQGEELTEATAIEIKKRIKEMDKQQD